MSKAKHENPLLSSIKPNGDIKHRAANRGHILSKNTPKIKRQRRGMQILVGVIKSILRIG